ncbi:MAG: hypothetical protein PHI59_02170 [Candidatus Omnitrophica bacterium]|nr:hypothetical protein [Candidatus Omnitrophota bacterium]
MKKVLTILIIVLVALLGLSVVKDVVIKTSVEKGTQLVTGLKLSMGSFKVGVINTLVDIKNLKLFNPSGYKDAIMLEMPEIYVKYDLPAIFQKKIHLPELRINMKEFTVVKNEKGELNLDSLKVVQAQKSGKKSPGKEGGELPALAIDNLQLKIGKVVFKDYSKGGTPSIREFNINLDEKYTNITNAYSLVSLIVVKALMGTSIASLTNFDLKGLQGSVSDVLGSAQKITGETVQKAQEAVSGAEKTLKEGLNKLPFGSGK